MAAEAATFALASAIHFVVGFTDAAIPELLIAAVLGLGGAAALSGRPHAWGDHPGSAHRHLDRTVAPARCRTAAGVAIAAAQAVTTKRPKAARGPPIRAAAGPVDPAPKERAVS
jgi:hypothetical protein